MGVLDVQLLVIYNVRLDVTLVHLALDKCNLSHLIIILVSPEKPEPGIPILIPENTVHVLSLQYPLIFAHALCRCIACMPVQIQHIASLLMALFGDTASTISVAV